MMAAVFIAAGLLIVLAVTALFMAWIYAVYSAGIYMSNNDYL